MSKPSHTIATFDMEAYNSEESEEEMAQYHMKTIFSWRKGANRSQYTESSQKHEMGINLLFENSEESKKSIGRYKRLVFLHSLIIL